MGWLRNLLIKVHLAKPPVERKGTDRRNSPRRWEGPLGEKPRALKDPRRKKERRKKKERRSPKA
jgi:hypothetical protein